MGVSYLPVLGEQTGGSTILSFNLQIDETGGGSGPWINVRGFS